MYKSNQYSKSLILKLSVCFGISLFTTISCFAHYTTKKGNNLTTPLHLLKRYYITPYGEITPAQIKKVLSISLFR
jgi:hypothetical protein